MLQETRIRRQARMQTWALEVLMIEQNAARTYIANGRARGNTTLSGKGIAGL